jgi:phosphate transport system substrate-binding protein
MSKWSAEYEAQRNVAVDYLSIGSGGGIDRLLEHRADFSCTDLRLTAEQQRLADESGGLVQIPILLTAVAPVYHLEGIDKRLRFSGAVMADLFLGRVRMWNDPALRALNPGVDLPHREITVLHRADLSGTTTVFTSYLSRVSDDWRQSVGSGASVQWPVGIGAKG